MTDMFYLCLKDDEETREKSRNHAIVVSFVDPGWIVEWPAFCYLLWLEHDARIKRRERPERSSWKLETSLKSVTLRSISI